MRLKERNKTYIKPRTFKEKWASAQYKRNLRENTFLWVIRICLGIVFAFPFYWAFMTSIKPTEEIISPTIDLFVKNPTFEHYLYVLSWRDYNTNNIKILTALFNTTLLTVIGGGINIAVTAVAGYAFAKLHFKGHKIIFRILLLSMMIPGVITMMPTFIVISRIKLWNIVGVMLPGISSVFNIFFMRQFFMTLPNELGESAEIDGAGEFTIFARIYLPQVTPALAALAIFNFQGGWNNFLMPYVILPTNQLVLSTFIRSFPTNNYGQTMAASMLATLPVLILFIVFQKYFMQSVAMTGIKE
jgi:multiple sugar transport system permease protein